jgi:hypothetical protein
MKFLVCCSDLHLCTRGEEKALPLTFTLSFVHNVNDYWFFDFKLSPCFESCV